MSIGPRRLGKYELQRRLGRGGMAEVWKALDTQLQRYVAIKFLHADLRTDPEFMMRFVREAQAIASLHHPNIVQLHDFHTADPSEIEADGALAYMVMDYVEGPTLAEYIRDTSRSGKFPPAGEIMHLFTAIGSAVDYAHQRGLIHRDIKPANIFLDQRHPSRSHMGKPILADFGIVKLTGVSTNTMTGWLGGTPSYISPEQAQGLPVTERSDIYSLGVVLYELCTGVRPFQGDNPSAIMMQHITVLPTPPHLLNPQISPALSEVILRSLAKDPAARFPTATAMVAQLAQALNTAPPFSSLSATSGRILYTTPVQPNSALPSLTPVLPNISSLSPPVMSPATRPFDKNTPSAHDLNTSQSGSMTPATFLPGATPPVQDASRPLTAQSFPGSPSLPSAPAQPSPPPRRKKTILLLSIALVLLVVASTLLGALYLRSPRGPTPTPTVGTIPQSIGQASFESSGLLDQQDNQGVEDELHIILPHIQNPAPGKHYYAWLLTDSSQPMQPRLLEPGPLPVSAGRAELVYKDPKQSNLLKTYSRFLIKEDSTPILPSSDSRSTWRYYAELPQTPSAAYNNPSALDNLRQLLVPSSSSQAPVGLVPQYLRNTAQIWEWSKTLKPSWNNKDTATLRQQSTRMLAYLDSSSYVYQSGDVQNGTQLGVDPTRIQVPMLFVLGPQQAHSTYSWYIRNQLGFLLEAPDITLKMRQTATHADNALDPPAVNWLQAVHDDAKQLVHMSDQQLLQPSTMAILEDLETQADYAYNGRTDPKTHSPQHGIAWIYQTILSLATFEVQPYSAKG